MTTKNETGDAVTIWLFSDFLFHFFFFFLYVEEFSFLSFYFFLFIAILIFFLISDDKQTKCHIYKKIAMMLNKWLIMSGLNIKWLSAWVQNSF